jgi:pilus assembly protein CpaF
MTIGRVAGCAIPVPSHTISKRHTRLVVRDGKVVVIDLKSTNGTYVNGKHVHAPVVLKGGDKIVLGDVEVRVEVNQNAPAPGPGGPDKGRS